jgi:hypothetical protein
MKIQDTSEGLGMYKLVHSLAIVGEKEQREQSVLLETRTV